jgi:glutamine synthetase
MTRPQPRRRHTVSVFAPADKLAGTDWHSHIAAIIRVERDVFIHSARSGLLRLSTETAFYVANQQISAAHAIRAHWRIETTSHYLGVDIRDRSLMTPIPQSRRPLNLTMPSLQEYTQINARNEPGVLRLVTYTFDDLKRDVVDGRIDTVLACQVDMQGRLMGKRFQAEFFVESAYKETHSCNYLLATDMEMETVSGYKATSWEAGYGDYAMKPDLSTLRRTPWLEGTALVLCDLLDHHAQKEVPHSPRAILKRQVKRLEDMGLKALMATELEFFLFNQTYDEARLSGYRNLNLASGYNEDYHIFQTTKEEGVMRAIRKGLQGADIPVENSKGEASAGQEEINVRYADALTMADRHVIIKNACKEIAWSKGKAITFLAKWHYGAAGSSSHIHQSLWTADGDTPLFFDRNGLYGMSAMMNNYLAGLLAHASQITYFLAPYINSYKRFMVGTFAPTKAIWSKDNRTAGYRLCGENTKAIRVECRVGGADLNPYLAMAALIAAGIDGIENKLELEPAFVGDSYGANEVREIPRSLREALAGLRSSQMLCSAFGTEVIDHYIRAAEWEQEEYDRRVTDWEVARGFERA